MEQFALLLDFAKAYDSLSREFMLAALEHAGIPPRFVTAVQCLHDGTSCRFLITGYESKAVAVKRGIRQGCPLAPMLFLIRLDALYVCVMQCAGIRGVDITANGTTREIKICGYADDIALYVTGRESTTAAMAELMLFGSASGLLVNMSKSVALPLVDRHHHNRSPHQTVQCEVQSEVAGVPLGVRVS